MTDQSQNNKRIAKNTLMLYIRMFLIMGVTLFSFRIILEELGEEGYGLYNVVAGIVILFSFLSSALTQSTQRFLSYHIGHHDFDELQKVFSTCVNVHIVIAVIILLLAETVGLWFLNRFMHFPNGMLSVANIVFQCSIITFLFQILAVPYQASIISNERMSFYAYFSILEAVLKLIAALILIYITGEKVIIYASILMLISISSFILYRIYCRRSFVHCKYQKCFDKYMFKRIFAFSGWNMLGGIGNVGATQGVNIILNIFRGVALNAAMGVSNQVAGAVSSFVSNMQMAFNPQIIKSYAAGDHNYFLSLIFRASRFYFFVIFVIGFPVMLCCSTIFDIWLNETPEYAVPFTQLIIVFCMIDAISGPLWMAAQACGEIKWYMIIISALIFSNVPVALMIMWLGFSPIWVIAYKVLINFIIHCFRILYLYKKIRFPALKYVDKVMKKISLYVMISLPIPIILNHYAVSLVEQVALLSYTVISLLILGYFILLTNKERKFIKYKIKLMMLKHNN